MYSILCMYFCSKQERNEVERNDFLDFANSLSNLLYIFYSTGFILRVFVPNAKAEIWMSLGVFQVLHALR